MIEDQRPIVNPESIRSLVDLIVSNIPRSEISTWVLENYGVGVALRPIVQVFLIAKTCRPRLGRSTIQYTDRAIPVNIAAPARRA